jgi:hypothetical protein
MPTNLSLVFVPAARKIESSTALPRMETTLAAGR